ncbi:hypothetical protein [Pseudomonas sp. UYIF39]|nr:hypothetical protein [Pseudomonas sp. UYIF39]
MAHKYSYLISGHWADAEHDDPQWPLAPDIDCYAGLTVLHRR